MISIPITFPCETCNQFSWKANPARSVLVGRTCAQAVKNTSCEYDKVQIRCRYAPLSLFEKDAMAHWARVMASKIPFLQAFLVEDMQTFELVDFLRAFDRIETNNTSKFVSSGDSAMFLKGSLWTEQSHQTK